MALLDSDLTPCRGRKSWSGMEAVAGAWRTDSGEGTRPDIRTNHCYNSQSLHRHEQSYPCTDVTSQTQRLLLISVYPSDWVCFLPTCVRASVCVCARSSASLSACACVSARIGAPVFVCMRVSIHVRSHPRFPLNSRLSSRADVEGDVKIKSHSLARSHAYRREEFLKIRGWEAYTEDPPEPCTPSYRPPPSLSFHLSIEPHCQTP